MKLRQNRDITNLPNTLTFIRMGCIPLVVFFLYFPGKLFGFLAGLFFALAFVTDILDGHFARKYGSVTALGKLMDPLADKLLVLCTMIMLISLGRIPEWVVMVILARELAVTGLRSIAAAEGVIIQSIGLGKYKTILQCVALVGLCVHYTYFGFDFHAVGMLVLWAALIVTLWSGFVYFQRFKKLLFEKDQ
ncbi:MAG: CDP-diacylglycerol--glycerol-3-phosphate 3-phosphatidyltransferase [Deltaproteobacteria bacterium]|nr:CDP-diacylglycerol--glycerol-3-phosphate 3-phosphatidyltransferase [Deltaproteobacteria bacterium]MBW2284421.1 CDP-diacylglycerol--glycerol-3-phosphate 3-phosphatidyltransferase [Deltaproteobacteria bacterium]